MDVNISSFVTVMFNSGLSFSIIFIRLWDMNYSHDPSSKVLSSVYNLLKWEVAKFLISSEDEITSPVGDLISSTLFLHCWALAYLWKKEVFLSPSLSHKIWDFNLHLVSSYFKDFK
jgi:hypothetical protein